jgi:hypothetical protein
VTYTVHYCEPMLEGMPERWSVVGMGPVAYCDSTRIARTIAHKLNNGYGVVCPDCDVARTISRTQVRAGMKRFPCHHCAKLLTIVPR